MDTERRDHGIDNGQMVGNKVRLPFSLSIFVSSPTSSKPPRFTVPSLLTFGIVTLTIPVLSTVMLSVAIISMSC